LSPQQQSSPSTYHTASFFDPFNTEASAVREQVALDTLNEIFDWLDKGGKVAIHDATNSSVSRRKRLLERVQTHSKTTNLPIHAFFVESICTDQAVLETNIQMKLRGPDYVGMDPDLAIKDFRARIENYEKTYQTISEEEEADGVR
jgi:6-phosphofructo-2-kinase